MITIGSLLGHYPLPISYGPYVDLFILFAFWLDILFYFILVLHFSPFLRTFGAYILYFNPWRSFAIFYLHDRWRTAHPDYFDILAQK